MATQLPVMGVYNNPSQLGQDVASNNDYTFGSVAPDLKTQLAAQKAQAAAYNPYISSLLRANTQRPQLDTASSADWGQGLAKGLGNIYGLQQYSHHQHQDEQALQQYQNMLQNQQVSAHQQADLLAQQQQTNAQHIRQQYGDEAAFAYMLNPGKYGEALGTHFGALPTAKLEAHDQSVGRTTGEGEGHLANVTANNDYLKQQGADPALANTGQLTPQAANLTQAVTGQNPQDLLDFETRQYKTGQEKNAYQTGGVNLQTLGARNTASLTGDLLGNLKSQLEADKMKLSAQFDPENMANDAKLKNLSVEDKTKTIAQRDQAMQMMDALNQQLAQGKTLTPSDAMRLDTTMKALGVPTNYVNSLKEIANPKAGQALKADTVQKATGASGYVTLPSGIQINPDTAHVIHPSQSPAASRVSPSIGQKPVPAPTSSSLPQDLSDHGALAAQKGQLLKSPGISINDLIHINPAQYMTGADVATMQQNQRYRELKGLAQTNPNAMTESMRAELFNLAGHLDPNAIHSGR